MLDFEEKWTISRTLWTLSHLHFAHRYNSFNSLISFCKKAYVYVNIFFECEAVFKALIDFQANPKIHNPRWQKLSFHFMLQGKQHKGETSKYWKWSLHLTSPGAVSMRLVNPLRLVHWCWRLPPDQTLVTCQAFSIMGSYAATDPHAHPAVKAFQFLIATWLVRFNMNHMATIKTSLIMRRPKKKKGGGKLRVCVLSLFTFWNSDWENSFTEIGVLHIEKLNCDSFSPHKTNCLCLHVLNISEILAHSHRVHFHYGKESISYD